MASVIEHLSKHAKLFVDDRRSNDAHAELLICANVLCPDVPKSPFLKEAFQRADVHKVGLIGSCADLTAPRA